MLEHSGWEQTQFGESALSLGDGLLDMRLAREHGVGHRVGFLPPGSAPDWGQQLLAAGATHLVQALDQVPQLLQSGLGRRGARIG